MRIILIVTAIIAFIVGITGFVTLKSDIQAIIGIVGLFSGVIMLGQATILGRMPD